MTNTKETQMKTGYAAKRRTAVSSHLFPEGFTFKHYQTLFTDPNVPYGRWMINTFIIAVLSCIISTLFVLMVSYALSRLRFKSRKKLLNAGLILGMFPGFMSMAATYSIMEIFHLDQQLFALVIVYSAGAGLGYQIIDARNNVRADLQPIIVYTALTTFLGPWADYIFVSYFMKDNEQAYTIALGLYTLIDKDHINNYFTTFCAGAVLIAVPITILFTVMQRYYVSGVTGGAVKG